MEIDKTTVGLSIILAVVVALTVFSASFPVSGSNAVQNVTVSKNTSAVKIVSQTGVVGTEISYWNFTGVTGATVATPTNNLLETQDPGTNQKGICTLNNTNSQTMSAVYISNGSWTADVVSDYKYYVSATGANPTDAAGINVAMTGSEIDIGSITNNENTSLWLKVVLKGSGSATSTFTVTSEV